MYLNELEQRYLSLCALIERNKMYDNAKSFPHNQNPERFQDLCYMFKLVKLKKRRNHLSHLINRMVKKQNKFPYSRIIVFQLLHSIRIMYFSSIILRI